MNYLSEINIAPKTQNSYPFNLPLFANGVSLHFNSPITFITGENGSGKSTLLESLAAAVGFNTLGGNKNHKYNSVGVNDNLNLSDSMKLIWKTKTSDGFFFRAESFLDFIKYVDTLADENGDNSYMPYGGKSLQKCSHGESFLALFRNRFRKGLFILDEPEAALSPEKQLSLLVTLSDLASDGCAQFIIATHSPILIACPNSELYQIESGILSKKHYKDSKQFQFYKDFINCPERYLKHL